METGRGKGFQKPLIDRPPERLSAFQDRGGWRNSTTVEAGELRRALGALRQSHPEIIVDADDNSPWILAQKEDFPWGYEHFTAGRTDLDWTLGLLPIMGA